MIDDDRVERSDNRDFVRLLFKSLYGHHTVKFARLVHLDFLLISSLSFFPPGSVISKLITVVNIISSPCYDDRGYASTTVIDFNIVKLISLIFKSMGSRFNINLFK